MLVGTPVWTAGPTDWRAAVPPPPPPSSRLFHCWQAVVQHIRQRAAAGDRDFVQLELDLFRWVRGVIAEGGEAFREGAARGQDFVQFEL